MATQNLFEKYGIKEVADVTFYRIEKKEETFESQRTITAASVLKGALELRTVYPVNEDGAGDENGFEAYVFTNANLIEGTNYDCDDNETVIAKLVAYYDESKNTLSADHTQIAVEGVFEDNQEAIVKAALEGKVPMAELAVDSIVVTDPEDFVGTELLKVTTDSSTTPATVTEETIVVAADSDLATIIGTTGVKLYGPIGIGVPTFVFKRDKDTGIPVSSDIILANLASSDPVDFTANVTLTEYSEHITKAKGVMTGEITLEFTADLATGVYNTNATTSDVSRYPEPGTHEFSYPQQVCMLFAKNQNLISKTGVRYVFENADTMFGDFDFNDGFASAPKSTDRIVVAGLVGKFDESSYDLDEIKEAFSALTNSIEAKAYDVTYTDYAELVVEDEMGYYNPAYLGNNYTRSNGNGTIQFFADASAYIAAVDPNNEGKYDPAIAGAVMWGDDKHYSINDAIDALRQKKLVLDTASELGAGGLANVFGGYKVSSKDNGDVEPTPGTEDTDNADNLYGYTIEGTAVKHSYNNEDIKTQYPLEQVVNALNEIGMIDGTLGKEVRVDYTGGKTSNRAIYVRVNGSMDTAASAYMYLLHNKNYNRLGLDKDGIFKFNDKKGNTLYYQDKIFKGVEWLALVIVGTKGLIFVVNRHGNNNITRAAWMVNDGGYVDNRKASILVKNGLIHTTAITANNETFEATCTVGGLKVHKTIKKANRYVPVLFLDTLKVSTIEQTAQEVYATGGKGNANLIGWDYGKEITLNITDALFTPASMAAIYGSYEGNDFRKGVKDTKKIDRMEKCFAKRSFIVPAGNLNGTPSEADNTAQAVYYDPNTMEPYADGTPIAEGEVFYKWTRSVAYEGNSLGNTIEISADKFPGTYKVVGDTYARAKETGADERFQFIIPQAKMNSEHTITLEAEGEPTVFEMSLKVLRPEDGVMVRFVQYDVVENEEENDGSTMVKDTENLNLLDDAELFKVSAEGVEDEDAIGATEY